MMNNRILKLFVFTVATLFMFSCKKVEEKFPPGYYQFDVDVHEVGESEDESFQFDFIVKLNSSSENNLQLQYFSFNNLGDTAFFDVSYLNVEDKKYVDGTLDYGITGGEPILFTKGEILKESRNNYIIKGQIDYQVWYDGGWEYYWRYYTGAFVFHRK